jgi:hypothetical protein
MITDTELLSPREAAAILHMSPGTLAIWRCKKRYPLRYVKVGWRVMYRRSDLVAFLESRTVEMNAPTPRRKRGH